MSKKLLIPLSNANQIEETATKIFFSPSEKTKLGNIQANAQVNQTITSGNGMNNWTATNGNLTIAMGTPGTITGSTSNSLGSNTHTHAITGFSETGHTHSYLPLSGGTLTNDLIISQAMTDGANAFSNPHLALEATNTVDTTGFVGMTFSTSTSANYGYSLGAQRTTNGSGNLKIRFHNSSSSGTEVLSLSTIGVLSVASDVKVSGTSVSLSGHTHTLANITNAGNIANINTNESTSNYLRGDGTWATPPNTTYSTISEAEIVNSTSDAARLITGRRMAHAFANIKATTAGTADSANAVTWTNVSSKPATATRWPTWSEVTSKPTTFAPSSHAHSSHTGIGANDHHNQVHDINGGDHTGTLTVANGGTGRTSLTANKVLVGNGTSAVNYPTELHWDNTNKRLGIGVATPGESLETNGNVKANSFKTASWTLFEDAEGALVFSYN